MPINARDVMTQDVTTVTEDVSIRDVIEIIREKSYSGIPVVDPNGKAVGLVSQNDVLRALAYLCKAEELPEEFQSGKRKASALLLDEAEGEDKGIAVTQFLGRSVTYIMTPHVLGCAPETPIAEVCEAMVKERIHRIVVLEDGKVSGLISATDLVRRFGQESQEA